MNTRPLLISALFVASLLAIPADAQTQPEFDVALYMTPDASTTVSGAEVLGGAVGGTEASHQFSPLLGATVEQVGPNSYDWATETPLLVDVLLVGSTDVTVYFATGIDATATTRATLFYVDDGVETQIATATHQGTAEISAHTETFALPTAGEVIPEGSILLLRVSVTGNGAIVEMLYNTESAPSGVTRMTMSVLDTDGDGFGDSFERANGYDPEDSLDYPGAPPKYDLDNDGMNDTWEATHFNITSNGTGASDDPDGDGCDNLCEFNNDTDPNNPDTDGDGRSDGLEIAAGTNPLVFDEPEETSSGSEESDGDSTEIWVGMAIVTLSLIIGGIALLGRFT